MPGRDAKARRSDLGLRASKYEMRLTRDEKSRRGDDSCGWGKLQKGGLSPAWVTDSGKAQGEPHVRLEVARKPDERWCKEPFSAGPASSLYASKK